MSKLSHSSPFMDEMDRREAEEAGAASESWRKKAKGYAHIYTHPSVPHAVVHRRYVGVFEYRGRAFETLEAAKAHALKAIEGGA